MKLPRLESFRTRLLLIVLAVAVFPLLVVGVWLTRTVSRSGHDLLRGRLQTAVSAAAVHVGQRWAAEQSVLLDLAESPEIRGAFAASLDPKRLTALAGDAEARAVQLIGLRDSAQRHVVRFGTDDSPAERFGGATIRIALPVHAAPLAARIGTLEARLPLAVLLGTGLTTPSGVGSLMGVYDADGLAPLLPLPFELPDPVSTTVSWGGESWLLATRELKAPPIVLVAAAPISPFAQPFRAAARDGVVLLALTGVVGLLAAILLTTRMTRSLRQLAAAADDVATGSFDLEVDARGGDEVSRVSRAFNNMTASLRRTLQEVADHKALAAMGEFAASLAHEVRNPLSAVRVDLQVVEEELPPDSELRRIQTRALREIQRLDATVSGALQSARAGRHVRATLPLTEPLQAAIATARISARPGIEVQLVGDVSHYEVRGDPAALQQLFLNLLLNATQAARTAVTVQAERSGDDVVITISDDGPGMPPEQRERAFEPLFTTRRGGTGLGLTIAQRIARAHDGAVELTSAQTGGTAAHVRLRAATSV